MTHRHGWFARAVARRLLALYPAHVRSEYGADIIADFLDTLASRRTTLDRAGFLAVAVVDAVRSAAAEHADAGMVDERKPLLVRQHPMFGFLGDVRFGLRALRRRPGFVAAVVLTLALGIGANTAVFSLIDAVFLHPVDVRAPESLVAIYQAASPRDPNNPTSYPGYRALRDGTRTLTGLAGATPSHPISVIGPEGPEAVNAIAVSGNYFSVLGITPFIGRLIGESDDGAHGASPFIVLSYRTWQRWYDGDRSIVGKTVTIDGRSFSIIGVAPATFRGTDLADMPDLWAPLSMITSLGIGSFFTPRMEQVVFHNVVLPWIEPVGRIRARLARQRAHIYWVVLRGSLLAVAIGGVAGIAIAVAGSSGLNAFLYGIRPLDTIAFATATTTLVVAAACALVLPARRAANTDSMATIRTE